jgi:ABC-type transport system involved in multi-copper enzyme maturation permease subunit
MLGPVFRMELLRAARRGQHHRLRALYAVALAGEAAVLLVLVWSKNNPLFGGPPTTPEALGALWFGALGWLVVQQLLVLLLAAPAFAAGSVSDEKTTGTLQHVLATPLESRHLIVGKWLAQVVQLAVLGLPAVPLVVLLGRVVGLPPSGLLALVLLPLLPLPGLVAAALLASVWSKETTSAVARLYLALAAAGLAAWLLGLGRWVLLSEVISATLSGDPAAWGELGRLALAWSCLVVLCLALASWRLRPAYRKQLPGETRPARARAWGRRPPVGNNPLRWKERYLGERGTLPVLGDLPRPVGLALVVVLTALAYGLLAVLGLPSYAVLACSLAMLFLACLLVAVRCAGVVSSERERQTWELLLLTPLKPAQILRGKLWGVLDSARGFLVAYLLAALPVVLLSAPAGVFWLVLTWLAGWLMTYFTGAAGVECSARAGNSWRALLAALVLSSWVVLQRSLLVAWPVGFVFTALSAGIVGLTVSLGLASVVVVIATAALLLAHAEHCLEKAEARVAEDRVAEGGGPRPARRQPGAPRPVRARAVELGDGSAPTRR